MLWMEVACLRLKGCVTRQQGAGVWAICGVCGVCGLRLLGCGRGVGPAIWGCRDAME